MKKLSDIEFEKSVSKRLDEYASIIDDDVLAKLDAGRISAMASKHQKLEAEQQQLIDMRETLLKLEELPSAVEIKLNKIRAQALSQNTAWQLPFKQVAVDLYYRLFGNGYGLGYKALTACFTVAAVGVFYGISEPSSVSSNPEDLLIIASSEELELYENLDFYLWLADNEPLN